MAKIGPTQPTPSTPLGTAVCANICMAFAVTRMYKIGLAGVQAGMLISVQLCDCILANQAASSADLISNQV